MLKMESGAFIDHVTDFSKASWKDGLIQKRLRVGFFILSRANKMKESFALLMYILERTGLFKELVKQLKHL